MLGRKLLDTEVVHHIDGNKKNNNPSNLMVFKTTGDHSRYHQMHTNINLIENPDGSFSCDKNDPRYIDHANKSPICPICGGPKSLNAHLCNKCEHKSRKSEKFWKVKHPSKEELSNLIKTYPMRTIGNMYGVSDKAVRKWCKSNELPSTYQNIKWYRNENCPVYFY